MEARATGNAKPRVIEVMAVSERLFSSVVPKIGCECRVRPSMGDLQISLALRYWAVIHHVVPRVRPRATRDRGSRCPVNAACL